MRPLVLFRPLPFFFITATDIKGLVLDRQNSYFGYTKVPVGFESLFHLNDNHAPVCTRSTLAQKRVAIPLEWRNDEYYAFYDILVHMHSHFYTEMPSLLPNFYPTPPYVYTVTEYAISRAWRRLRGRNRRFL